MPRWQDRFRPADAVRELSKAEQALVSDLVRSSRAHGVALTG
ncbi:putative transposase [Gordonia terrae NBRC 100016]|uniref:Transposase n=1 Tax=Gordonia terrae NBRC 100016 TaxID=1089454 RepID=A0ABQ0HKG0_9ACTN|nr:putative transposase [Gordonia terrae NBRC 100016]